MRENYLWEAMHDTDGTITKWSTDSPPDGWLTSSNIDQTTIRIIDSKPYKEQKSDASSSTTDLDTFQTKLSLTTQQVRGDKVILWGALMEQVSTDIEVRLQETTQGNTIGPTRHWVNHDGVTQNFVSGFNEVYFDGSQKTFEIQYRSLSAGTSVGLSNAKIVIQPHDVLTF